MKSDHVHVTASHDPFKPTAFGIFLAIVAVLVGSSQPVVAAELEEILVTAQKREQSLQDVPMFVSAISAEELDASNIMNFNELGKLAPGIAIDGPSDGLGSTIRIRGIGVTRNIEGIRPSVGIFVDDVPLGRIDNAFTNFSDIVGVEILKGPQATLFGKEVSSGAILIRTKKPSTEKFEGSLGANLGNFGLQQYRGSINVPMGNSTAARLSGYWTSRDSEIENVVTGRKGETETWGARMRFLRDITDDVEAILTLERHEAQVRSMVKERVAYGQYTMRFATATGVSLLPIDVFDRRTQADAGDGRSHAITNAALHLSWNINEVWSLASVTAHQKFERDNDESDRAGGVNDTSTGLFGTFSYLGLVDDEVLSQELRLTYEGDSLSTVMGVFYEDADLLSITDILVRVSPTVSAPVRAYGDRRSKDHAIFVHNEYKINDQWKLIAGLRYSEVEKDDRIDNQSRYGAFGILPAPIVPARKDSWSSVSGTAKLSYQIREDVSVYGGYDRGFKAGGHNTVSSLRPNFDEEIVDSYEVGIKGLILDRRLRWSASVFTQEYKDFQVNSPSTTGATSFIQNAASVEISGVETQLTWMINDKFLLDGTLAYIDSKYGDFRYAECTDLQKSVTPGCTQDLTGRDINGNSPFTWNISAKYESALASSNLNWHVHGELAHRDEMEGSANLDPRTFHDDYTLFNASVGLSSADGVWSLSLWGKNLTDEDYVSVYEVARDGLFGLLADLGDSRAYGVNLKYNF